MGSNYFFYPNTLDSDLIWIKFVEDYVLIHKEEYNTDLWREFINGLDIGLLYKFKTLDGKKCHVYYIIDEQKYMLAKIEYGI